MILSLLNSQIFSLGIILLIFSIIVFIIKTKINELENKVSTLNKVVQSVVEVINSTNPMRGGGLVQRKPVQVVSDNEDSDDDDDDDSEGYDSDDESNNSKENISDKLVEELNKENIIEDLDTTDVNVTENINADEKTEDMTDVEPEIENVDEDLETVIELKSLSDVKTIDINDIDDTQNDNELIVTKEPNQEILEENKTDVDLNTKNVKELKKLVTARGGKVSSLKTKDELIEYLKNNE